MHHYHCSQTPLVWGQTTCRCRPKSQHDSAAGRALSKVTIRSVLETYTESCAADAGPTGGSNGHSTSVMFVIYMLIGFTVTLACIVVLTLLYFLIR